MWGRGDRYASPCREPRSSSRQATQPPGSQRPPAAHSLFPESVGDSLLAGLASPLLGSKEGVSSRTSQALAPWRAMLDPACHTHSAQGMGPELTPGPPAD